MSGKKKPPRKRESRKARLEREAYEAHMQQRNAERIVPPINPLEPPSPAVEEFVQELVEEGLVEIVEPEPPRGPRPASPIERPPGWVPPPSMRDLGEVPDDEGEGQPPTPPRPPTATGGHEHDDDDGELGDYPEWWTYRLDDPDTSKTAGNRPRRHIRYECAIFYRDAEPLGLVDDDLGHLRPHKSKTTHETYRRRGSELRSPQLEWTTRKLDADGKGCKRRTESGNGRAYVHVLTAVGLEACRRIVAGETPDEDDEP